MYLRCLFVSGFCLLPSLGGAQNLSQSEVIDEMSYQKGGRKITITEIEPPVLKNVKSEITSENPPLTILPILLENQVNEGVTQKTFTVMATTYDNRVTKLTITPHAGGETTEAWSNLNWNHLTSISSFQGEEESFSMLLLQSNASLKALRQARKKDKSIKIPKVPKNLPKLKKQGPHYTLSETPSSNQEEALDFLETIHNHYALERSTIVKSYKSRQKQQAKEKKKLAENPPKPKDMKIIFWDNKQKP